MITEVRLKQMPQELQGQAKLSSPEWRFSLQGGCVICVSDAGAYTIPLTEIRIMIGSPK